MSRWQVRISVLLVLGVAMGQAPLEASTKTVVAVLKTLSFSERLNSQKGDGDAATWLPPRKDIRCAYVAQQIVVKAKYKLWVTPAEKAAMVALLEKCPGFKAPAN